MAYVATAPFDYAQDVSPRREFSATLRLRQGSSARSSLNITEAPGGTMVAVGADPACDWQVRAPFVPARAFSILVVGGRAFLRSGPEPGLLLDGKPVDDSWNALPAQSRIDVGLARFEVSTGFGDASSQEPVLELSQARRHNDDVQTTPAAVVQARSPRRKATMETQEYGREVRSESSRVQRVGIPAQQRAVWDEHLAPQERPGSQERLVTPLTPSSDVRRQPLNNSTIELRFDDLDYVGTIPFSHQGNAAEHAMSPSLLGGDEITSVIGPSQAWRFVGVATFFAGAYGAWLYLLDQL